MDFSDTPLKDMDAAMLTMAILQATGYNADVCKAIELASYCHKDKTRANPNRNSKGKITQATSPYIEHPLRVALRVIRWGRANDINVVCAAILHDTVEDHADKLAVLFEDATISENTSVENRSSALDHITNEFNVYVSLLVEELSNDLLVFEDRAARDAQYRKHVANVIVNLDVFIIKFSDFCDNALGLHHQQGNPKMVKRLAEKYIGLVPIFRNQYGFFVEHGMFTNANVARRLMDSYDYLDRIINA